MLQHVSLEVPVGEVERSLRFWELLGFERVAAPREIADSWSWVEREGTQVHLIERAEPTVPTIGHVAVVAPDFEATIVRLRDAGFEVERKRELWGAPRAGAIAPGGHRVELMAAPPERRKPS